METRLEIKNEVEGTADLILYGTIRQAYPWEDENACISANRVIKALEGVRGKSLNIHINSGGGDVFESIAICNQIKQFDGEVTFYVDGRAGSGASVLLTAQKRVLMYPNTMQMIHNAWTAASGNAKALRKIADDLDKISNAAKMSYMDKFVGTEEELDKLLDAETWLTAEECLAFGLCSEIIKEPEKEEEEPEPQQNIKESLFAKYRNNISKQDGEEKKASLFCAFKK